MSAPSKMPPTSTLSDRGATSPNARSPLYTIPIAQRPAHGPLFSKIFFPLFFNLGQLGINSAQFLAVPLLLIPFGIGQKLFRQVIDYTKDGYGRLLILITVLFGPTTLVLTSDSPPDLANMVERDPQTGLMSRINLPDRLVIIANHQAYLDWMYVWIIACYAGHARGLVILLKASLRKIPVIGWGMRFFRFIFLNRSWASDKQNLTKALQNLGRDTREDMSSETSGLLRKNREPVWLLIFPEGTITSDEERAKSVRYAKREAVDDFVTLLHPRSTGLLFCLRTLLPEVPDLQILDLTIGYPGVPYGKYPQEWYGLLSVFYRSVPPPTVHIHMHLYSNLASPSSPIPSLASKTSQQDPSAINEASPEETQAFELWLRGLWTEKEKRMEGFFANQQFESEKEERIPIRELRLGDWIAAFGAGGMATAAVLVGMVVGAVRRIRT